MSKRKPLAETIEAFRAAPDPRLRLVLKAQVERQAKQVTRMIRGGSRFGRRDRRIEVITADLPTDEYLRMFAAADACLAPSRWEGLGLHLFEATALGRPGDHQRQPADERGRHRWRQRAARPRDPRRPRSAVRASPPSRRTSRR